MNTAYILMVQYNAQVAIPIETVVRDYFPHLGVDKFLRAVAIGRIELPVMRLGPGKRAKAQVVHMADLVRYIERQRELALQELDRRRAQSSG